MESLCRELASSSASAIHELVTHNRIPLQENILYLMLRASALSVHVVQHFKIGLIPIEAIPVDRVLDARDLCRPPSTARTTTS